MKRLVIGFLALWILGCFSGNLFAQCKGLTKPDPNLEFVGGNFYFLKDSVIKTPQGTMICHLLQERSNTYQKDKICAVVIEFEFNLSNKTHRCLKMWAYDDDDWRDYKKDKPQLPPDEAKWESTPDGSPIGNAAKKAEVRCRLIK